MNTPIVTLTTDWGDGSFFAGMVKGLLYNLVDNVQVVDICHKLEAYNVMTATFVVRHACLGFPPGTVHIIDVASQQPYLCVKARNQYYLCSDNGLPHMVFGDEIEDVSLLPTEEGVIYNFAAYNLFVPAAAKLLRGATMRDLGEPPAQIKQRTLPRYIKQGDNYRIYVHHIDSYGNAYLGMTYREFAELRGSRNFVLTVRDAEVTELMLDYHQQRSNSDPNHKMRLTVSATGLLELALKESSLARLIGLRVNDSVLLRFK
ncbi:MAG: SAM-dependent chlorinase/fluorinase [Bacteroidales bacterium]|nr:SAM-dependent chlorinase/fluorinase [Bacteroidales bacterium]